MGRSDGPKGPTPVRERDIWLISAEVSALQLNHSLHTVKSSILSHDVHFLSAFSS
jgi:hypothetical protein